MRYESDIDEWHEAMGWLDKLTKSEMREYLEELREIPFENQSGIYEPLVEAIKIRLCYWSFGRYRRKRVSPKES